MCVFCVFCASVCCRVWWHSSGFSPLVSCVPCRGGNSEKQNVKGKGKGKGNGKGKGKGKGKAVPLSAEVVEARVQPLLPSTKAFRTAQRLVHSDKSGGVTAFTVPPAPVPASDVLNTAATLTPSSECTVAHRTSCARH